MAKDETVEELIRRWNPPPEEHRLDRLLGQRPEEGDTRATVAAPANTPHSADADGDSEESYEDMTVAELKAEIDSRNEDRDDDDQISKSGNKDDLIAALEADDDEE